MSFALLLPGALSLPPILALLPSAIFRGRSRWEGISVLSVLLAELGLLLTVLFLDFPGSPCRSCALVPRPGLLLSPVLLGAMLPHLVLPDARRLRSLALPVLCAGLLALTLPGPGGVAIFLLVLVLAFLLLERRYPGAYAVSFRIRNGIALVLVLLPVLVPGRAGSFFPTLFPGGLAAALLLLPGLFPRRTGRVLDPEFLRTDQVLVLGVFPLLIFEILQGGGPGPTGSALPLLPVFIALLAGAVSLLAAKTATLAEDFSEGLSGAGISLSMAGFLTGSPLGRQGAFFMVLLLPLAGSLAGLVFSRLPLVSRGRSFRKLSGSGNPDSRLGFYFSFAAFQGMSLPVVGSFQGEWPLLRALTAFSFPSSILAIAGIFLAFLLVLDRGGRTFLGDRTLSGGNPDPVSPTALSKPERGALGLALAFLLAADLWVFLEGLPGGIAGKGP